MALGSDLFRAILKSSARTRIFSRVSAESACRVDIREVSPERFHGGFAGERREVRTDEPWQTSASFGEEPVAFLLDAFDSASARVNLQDISLRPLRSGTPISISRRRTGRRSAGSIASSRSSPPIHDDLAATEKAVHQGEELRDDAPSTSPVTSSRFGRSSRVPMNRTLGAFFWASSNFSRRRSSLCSVVLRHDLRALDRIEVRAGFVGHRLRDERLAGAAPVQEDPLADRSRGVRTARVLSGSSIISRTFISSSLSPPMSS